MTVLLKLEAVQTHIGAYHILHGVDFEVPAGGVTVLLGRNGAGKTTTLRTIMGLWRASKGSVAFDGQPIQAMATPEIARLGQADDAPDLAMMGCVKRRSFESGVSSFRFL